MSSSPPIRPVSSATGFGKRKKLAPASVDFQTSGLPGEAEKRQLWESAFMFGSAGLSPVPFSGRETFAAKVADLGRTGGLYALRPLFCFVNHVLVMQVSGGQSGVRLSGNAMFAFPSGSIVIV